MGNARKGFDEHVHGEILTGEIAPCLEASPRTETASVTGAAHAVTGNARPAGAGFFREPAAALLISAARGFLPLLEKRLNGIAALLVDAAAGLHAAAPQAALAAHVAGPVAASGDAVAQGAVDEAFEHHAVGAGIAHLMDFIDGEFAGQNYAVSAEAFGLQKRRGVCEIGESGQRDGACIPRLTGDIDEGDILDNEAVDADLVLEAADEPVGGVGFSGLDERVHGHGDPAVRLMGEIREP